MYVISYKVMEGDNHVVTNCFTGITICLSTNCAYCCRFLIYWPYVRVIYRFTGATFRVPPYYVFAYFCRVYGIYYSDAVISTL